MRQIIARIMDLPSPRELEGWHDRIYLALCFALVGLVFYHAGPAFLGRVTTEYGRGLFLVIVYAMVLIRYPAMPAADGPRVPWYDWLLVVISTLAIGYWIVEFRPLMARIGAPTPADLVFGSAAVLIALVNAAVVWSLVLLG